MDHITRKNMHLKWLSILFIIIFIIIMTYLINRTGNNDMSSIVLFTTLFVLIVYLSDMGLLLKYFISLNFIFSLLYAYYMYSNYIINFLDTLGYLSDLNRMLNSNNNSLRNVINYAGSLHIGYQYLNYFIFKIFKSEFSLYLVNIIMSKLSIILFYYHLKKRYKRNIAVLTSILLIMSMHLFIFTTNLLKDSLVLFFAMLSLYKYEKYIDNKKILYLISLTIILSFLTMTRIYAGVGIALGILIDYLVANNIKIGKTRVFCFIIIIITLIIVSPLNAYISMGIKFLGNIKLSGSFIIKMLKATISFFLSPVFWNMTKEITIYTPIILDSIFFLIYSPLIFILLLKLIINKNYRKIMCIYYIPILVHILALGIQYETGAIRQKIAVYPFIVFLYVFELKQIGNKLKL